MERTELCIKIDRLSEIDQIIKLVQNKYPSKKPVSEYFIVRVYDTKNFQEEKENK